MTTDHFRTPEPSLTYNYFGDGPSGDGLIGDVAGVRLHRVDKVTVWRKRGESLDNLQVFAEGPMQKKDGTRGKHSRCLSVKVGVAQPQWLQRLVSDARPRLGAL